MESDVIEGLDRQILQALQIDGRAPFARIAEVLGVSDQTVARRYARLRADHDVQVVGVSDSHAVGEVPWNVRIRCTPDASASVADALARRDDTAWVHVTSGGTEIVTMVRGRDGVRGDELLLSRLPRTPRVVSLTAQCVMHTFFGMSESPLTKSTVLDADQVAALTPEDETSGEPLVLTDVDRRLLAALAGDARTPLADLAAVTGTSPTTVRRRMTDLRLGGALYFDVDVDSRLLGYAATVMMWLTVAPSHLAEVGQALASHPEVAFAGATTGATHIHAAVVCRDVPAVYDYLTTRVATLPSVAGVETAPVMRTLKGSAGPPPPLTSSPQKVNHGSGATATNSSAAPPVRIANTLKAISHLRFPRRSSTSMTRQGRAATKPARRRRPVPWRSSTVFWLLRQCVSCPAAQFIPKKRITRVARTAIHARDSFSGVAVSLI